MKAERYRVDLLLSPSLIWVNYTSHKKLVVIETAQALAAHLQRNKTGYRILEIIKKGKTHNLERTIEEWRPESSPRQEQSTIKTTSS